MNKLFSELALKNVKKSFRDYLIYFFTLSLGIAMFYTFNSIRDQFKILNVRDTLNYVSFAVGMMAMLSVFVSIIIGFLIVYANQFLLKRRKKEMGLYITLGMKERDIAKLLMKETLFIGFFSMVTGILLGVVLSQGLMLLSAKIIGLGFRETRFFISIGAVLSSILFFAVLFFIVHCFNIRAMKKMQLIDLLKAEQQNESIKSHSVLSVLVFGLSIAAILGGYYWLIRNPSNNLFNAIGIGVVMIAGGTVLFFFSVSEILIKILENKRDIYYTGLNMFVLRQLGSKIRSSGLSISVICILLFLSITAMSTGPGSGQSAIKIMDKAVPYDASFTVFYNTDILGGETQENTITQDETVAEMLEGGGIPIGSLFQGHGELSIYYWEQLTEKEFLLSGYEKNSNNERFGDGILQITGIEDFNRCMALQGKEEISLKENEFALAYNIEEYGDIYGFYEKNHISPIVVNGHELQMKPEGVFRESLEIENTLENNGTVIVPQDVAEGLILNRAVFFGDFADSGEKGYDRFLTAVRESPLDLDWRTKQDTIVEITMDNVVSSYAGLYLGLCFLITAGAVLALQQLSQSADNEKRFLILKKLGTKEEMMSKAVKTQVKIYFGLPLGLACVHSLVVVTGIFRLITNLSNFEKLQYVFISLGIVLAVYGLYFVSTYIGSRRIIREMDDPDAVS